MEDNYLVHVSAHMDFCCRVKIVLLYFNFLVLGPKGAELGFGLCSCFLFLFLLFVSHLLCKINLSRRCLWCLDSRVVSTSDPECFGPGSILGSRVSNFFLFVWENKLRLLAPCYFQT